MIFLFTFARILRKLVGAKQKSRFGGAARSFIRRTKGVDREQLTEFVLKKEKDKPCDMNLVCEFPLRKP
jgi:hypothetical protein